MSRSISKRKLAIGNALFVIGLGQGFTALAQDRDEGPTPRRDETMTVLEDIVVTAQKREEALQDVPIVVNALSSQMLEDAGVRDIKDMESLVSGFTVTSTQSEAQTTARIRGIGTVGDNPGIESSVGVVIDGVYRPRNGVGFGDLGEIERVEILKGPQGTLFGKNTSAGVVNIVTKRPTGDRTAYAEVTGGDYGAIGVAASYGDAFSDSVSFRLYGTTQQRDGFNDVAVGAGPSDATEDQDQDFSAARAQLRFQPTDDFDINFALDFSKRDENCCASVTIVRGPTAAILDALVPDTGVAPVADPFAREAFANRATSQEIEDKGVTLNVGWDTQAFGGARLTSITAQRQWDSLNGLDIDFSTADLLYRDPEESDNYTEFEFLSQEFQLAGASSRVDWLFGLFYSDEKLARNEAYRVGAAYEPYMSISALSAINLALGASPTAAQFFSQATGRPFGTVFAGVASSDRYEQDAQSLALFTNNTWRVTKALDMTVGVRYTREEKELDSVYSNPNGGLGCDAMLTNPAQVVAALVARGLTVAQASAAAPQIVGIGCLPWTNVRHNGRIASQSREENEFSGTVKAAYRFNSGVLGYVSAARGYKAGGFNLDRVQSSNGLSNGAAGIAPVSDTSFPGEFVNSFELGAKTTWMEGNLLFNATLFYQDFSDFQLNSFVGTSFVVRAIPEVTSRGIDADLLWQTGNWMVQAGLTYADTEYGDDVLPDAELALLPGNRPSFAPELSFVTAIGYRWNVGSNLVMRANVGAKYMSEYNTGSDLDPQKQQDAYAVANARLELGSRSQNWNVELWSQNITDEEYFQVAIDAPLQSGSWNAFLGAPQSFGLTVRFKY
jgi:outer membrane receptor protein involved in Fe transport